jgi:anti-anti-sigma factor
MDILIDSMGDLTIVRIKETRMTLSILHDLSDQITQQVEAGTRKLLIDLSEVSYLDSASFGYLMDVHRLMVQRSGTVKLLGLQERLEPIANMVGLTHKLEAFRDEKEAIESFY